jgi:GcrA cell cycle regulator
VTYDPYDQAGTYWSAARDAELRAIWPTWTPDEQVRSRLNAMPGRTITEMKPISSRALKLGVFRPEEFAREQKRKSALIGAAKAQARRAAGELPPIPHERKHDDTFRARVAELWAGGYSASAIGRELSTHEKTVTKNTIIRLAHDMHLTPRLSPIRAAKPRSHHAVSRTDTSGRVLMGPQSLPAGMGMPEAAAEPPVWFPAVAPMAGQAPRYALPKPHQCCWPLGEPGRPGFRFCDANARPGRPYCQPHCVLAYIPKPRPQMVAA